MNPKKIQSTQKGYSATEAKKMLDKYIDESSDRLKKKLQTAWRKQSSLSKKLSYA